MQSGARAVGSLDHAVHETRLVLQQQLGQHIAGRDWILVETESPTRRVWNFRQSPCGKPAREIAQVIGNAILAGDIPPAEALMAGNAVASLIQAIGRETSASRAGDDRFDDQPRNIPGLLRRMAIHAPLRTLDAQRAVIPWKVEYVIDAAQSRIERDNLHPSAGDIPKVNVFVEIQRARIGGRNQTQLQTGGGEDEHLRADRNIQGLQPTEDKCFFARAVEFDLARLQSGLQSRKSILRRALAIVVGRLVDLLETGLRERQ